MRKKSADAGRRCGPTRISMSRRGRGSVPRRAGRPFRAAFCGSVGEIRSPHRQAVDFVHRGIEPFVAPGPEFPAAVHTHNRVRISFFSSFRSVLKLFQGLCYRDAASDEGVTPLRIAGPVAAGAENLLDDVAHGAFAAPELRNVTRSLDHLSRRRPPGTPEFRPRACTPGRGCRRPCRSRPAGPDLRWTGIRGVP